MSVRKFFEINKDRFPETWQLLFPVVKAEEVTLSEEAEVQEKVQEKVEPLMGDVNEERLVQSEVQPREKDETKPVERMTKNELKKFILEEFGVEADDRMNKNQLLKQISDMEKPLSIEQ